MNRTQKKYTRKDGSPRTRKSRTAFGSVPLEAYERYHDNVRRIRDAGGYFGRDATGMAFIAVDAEGKRLAGPWSACETCAEAAVRALPTEETP